jgi:uncharacterized membrane protein YedE/YeeE
VRLRARGRALNAARTALVGLLLGFALSRIGFASWDEVHRMFTLADPRLLLTFGGAVVAMGLACAVLTRRLHLRLPARPIHKGTIAGGVIFGVGWALSGACPAVALVQLGEGQLGSVATLLGIVFGNWVYPRVHARWLRWPAQSCMED